MEGMNTRPASPSELLRGARLALDAALTAFADGDRVEPHLRAAQYFLSRIGDFPVSCCVDTPARATGST